MTERMRKEMKKKKKWKYEMWKWIKRNNILIFMSWTFKAKCGNNFWWQHFFRPSSVFVFACCSLMHLFIYIQNSVISHLPDFHGLSLCPLFCFHIWFCKVRCLCYFNFIFILGNKFFKRCQNSIISFFLSLLHTFSFFLFLSFPKLASCAQFYHLSIRKYFIQSWK